MSLTPLKNGISLNELDNWGSIADLGSHVLEGQINAFGRMTFGAPTDSISAAYFGTNQGKFRMTYPFSEQATLLSGELKLTDESSGITTHFHPGDSWFVEKGTPVVWEVVSENGFVKHYLAFT